MAKIKILGLMSGTSADGLSIALCVLDTAARKLSVTASDTYPYGARLQERILSAREMPAYELSALNFELGRFWSLMIRRFCKEKHVRYGELAVIGSHGQTIYHAPGLLGYTLQIGEPAFLAEETGVPVVADFRPSDMAAGGQGAPLIPFMDEYLFGRGAPVALQNIGGIGNIAFVGRGLRTSGFDTGPGNSLMDTAASMLSGGKLSYDPGGKWALAGTIDHALVRRMLANPYFALKPPKSLDRSEFSAAFLEKHFAGKLKERNKYNIMATLNYFTAASIAVAFGKFAPKGVKELIVSGGGVLNPVLMRNIACLLPGTAVKSIAEFGIAPLAKEPACFALLAWLALNGIKNNSPAATGASGPRVLGKILKCR